LYYSSFFIIVFLIFPLPHQDLLIVFILSGFFDQLLHVVGFINIDEAEFLEVDKVSIIIVQEIVNYPIVLQRHGDATGLKALYKLIKFNFSVKIEIKLSECFSVIFELLLETHMYLPQ